MSTKKPIDKLSIRGFKSIKEVKELKLTDLNVLIGGNGVGKSNIVSYFRMLSEMMDGRLQSWTKNQGSADRILSFGVKETNIFQSFVEFGLNGYQFKLSPTVDGKFIFESEKIYFQGDNDGPKWITLGSGHEESKLKDEYKKASSGSYADYCYSSISSWKVYHFHDTSDTAGVKRLCSLHDHEKLRSDASNLAAYLYYLRENHGEVYQRIRKTVQLAIPFFDDFVLNPQVLPSEEAQIRLLWSQKDTDYSFWPNQLSDGSIRFICLITALLQPDPPSTLIIDEPELGLHPFAITLLGSAIRSASKNMQIIVSTQSVSLLNEFDLDNLITVERENQASIFKRLNEEDFKGWLEKYSVGELWEKNILGGRPKR